MHSSNKTISTHDLFFDGVPAQSMAIKQLPVRTGARGDETNYFTATLLNVTRIGHLLKHGQAKTERLTAGF